MATFALVHGAWFGGWCWTPLAAELRKMGHTVVAPDLPIEDPEAGIAEYAAVIEAALDSAGSPAGDDVILVGHSLGGLTIPVVAEHRPVAGLIFLCAFLPDPGQPMHVDVDTYSPEWATLSANQVTHDDGSTSWPEDAAIQAFFHDCEMAVAQQCARQLRRQAWTPANQENPLEGPADRARGLRPVRRRPHDRSRLVPPDGQEPAGRRPHRAPRRSLADDRRPAPRGRPLRPDGQRPRPTPPAAARLSNHRGGAVRL